MKRSVVVLATLALLGAGCASQPIATPAPTTAPGLSPVQPRCVAAAPTKGIIVVANSSPSQIVADETKRQCDRLVSQYGWTLQPLDTPTGSYRLICTLSKLEGQFTLAAWSLPDEPNLGVAYNMCGALGDVVYAPR